MFIQHEISMIISQLQSLCSLFANCSQLSVFLGAMPKGNTVFIVILAMGWAGTKKKNKKFWEKIIGHHDKEQKSIVGAWYSAMHLYSLNSNFLTVDIIA